MSIRRRILLDLIVTPSTIMPFTVGISLILISFIVGGMAAFIGICSCIIGMGALVTNLIFNLGKITNKALREMDEEASRRNDRELDALDKKLSSDGDHRSQESLRNLRIIYKLFNDDLMSGKIKHAPQQMVDQIRQIFTAVIFQLQQQYDIWETSLKLTGKLKSDMQQHRSLLLGEIESSVNFLAGAVSEVRTLGLKSTKGQLVELQNRLQSQLQIARSTEDRLADIAAEEANRFREYENH